MMDHRNIEGLILQKDFHYLSFRSCLCCVLCFHKATMARDTNGKVDDMVAIGFKSLFEYLCFM